LQGLVSKVAIADAWQAWFDNPKKRNPGEATLRSYGAQWKRFKTWLTDKHKNVKYIHEVTPTISEEYASDLWSSKVTPRTYNAHTGFLRSMFKVLKVRAGLTGNVWDDIPNMEKEQESRRNLTSEELKEVCSTAKGNLRYWLAIGLYTGLRLGDVVTLKWDEINLDEDMIERVPMKTKRKNKKVRFPIHPVLGALLQELRKNSNPSAKYLFPDDARTYKLKNWEISRIVQAHFETCGIQTTEEPSNGHRRMQIVRVGFHSLRHSFVSMCATNKVPQVAIMELVGHGSPAMTALYSHAGDDQKAKAIAALPDVVFREE